MASLLPPTRKVPLVGSDMASFWDERARENAAYFVDNTLDYRSPNFDRFWEDGPRTVDRVLALVDAPAIPPDAHVVEIGCGIGRLTRALAARAASVRALDVSAEMLERARAANPGLDTVEWLHGDGATLTGIADASTDVVFSHVVFQHIPDPSITLGYVCEMGRVLRPGGWAAFQISNDPDIHLPRHAPAGFGARLGRLLRRRPGGQGHPAWLGSSVDLGDLAAAAADGGLEVAHVVGAGTQFCLVRLRRSPTSAR